MSHFPPETVAGTRKLIGEMAADAFKDHVLTKVSDERWKCARPNSWTYGFFVCIYPGTFVVYGDIGDMIIHTGASLKDAAADPSYLISKMVKPAKDFYAGEAIRYCEENLDRAKKGDFDFPPLKKIEQILRLYAAYSHSTKHSVFLKWFLQ